MRYHLIDINPTLSLLEQKTGFSCYLGIGFFLLLTLLGNASRGEETQIQSNRDIFVQTASTPDYLSADTVSPGLTSSTGEVLSLESALVLGLENSRRIRIAAMEINKAEAQRLAFRTNLFPQTNLYMLESFPLTPMKFHFKKGMFGSYEDLGPIPDTDVTLETPQEPQFYMLAQITQPLSQIYRIKLGIDIYGLSREIAKEDWQKTRNETAENIRKLYFGILQAQDALEASNQNLEFYAELQRLLQDYLKEETVLPSDLMEVQAALANEQYQNLTTRHQLADYKEQLNHLLGRNLHIAFQVEDPLKPAPQDVDLEKAIETALAHRPELKSSEMKIQQAQNDIKIKKNEYYPDISLSAGNIYLQDIDVLPRNVATAGILVQWNPFDWGKNREEVQLRQETLKQAQTAREETESLIRLEVETKYRKVRESRSLLQVARKNLAASQEKLRITRNRFQQQAALLKDMLEAQSKMTDARFKYQQALLNSWSVYAEWTRVLGQEALSEEESH